ncbi:hypothetical protein Ocin01_07903 [Orchesella cincta]|uniref:F-box domain-containing protein n=1 Tax=Orchesella cincta TaxID=48709 RepID=A0A1D2N1K6_ORCCI|nr:hypothetical protein Ocin01_07903 [Orchesella cincta]
MGQRITHLKKSKTVKSKSTDVQGGGGGKKYPLPIESLILRRIHKQYATENGPANKTDIKETKSVSLGLNDLISDESQQSISVLTAYPSSNSTLSTTEELDLEEVAISVLHEISSGSAISALNELRREREQSIKDQNNNAPFNLLDFPILVIENLLKHFSPSSILALRATCQTTKAWVEADDKYLADFQVKIEPTTCEYHSPPSTGPWSNFAIPYIRLSSGFIQDTIDRYYDIIWNLKIFAPKTFSSVVSTYPCQDSHRLFKIIYQCPLLQILSLCRLDTLTNLGSNQQQLDNLRVLSIDRIQWMKHSDFSLFEGIIMKCPNLEYLKIPEFEILGSLAFIFYDANTQPEVQNLIYPLIKYLDTYRTKEISSKLYIDVVEYEDFKLCSSEAFYDLSRKCMDANAVLMNVYFVPRDAALRNQEDIVESFASMFGFIKIDFHAGLWRNLEVMECWIEDFPEDVDLTTRQLEFLKTIPKIHSLKSLTIRMSVEEPEICSAALNACVGQEYSRISKLILRRHCLNASDPVRIPIGFGKAFANIKHLYFQELDSKNEDFQHLWPDLVNLEELFMYKCPYLTQEAFLGSDPDEEPPILKLSKLQVVVVFLQDGVSGFDDQFIQRALKYMKLKGFALRGVSGVDFTEEGMLSLLNTPFHDSVEDFEAPSSSFRPTMSAGYWRFYLALPKKELRQNRIWLSCSVLLNSLSSKKHPYDFKRKCLSL